MSRILVIRGGALGDFILTLPAIRLLRGAFPAAHLEILGYQHIISLAEMSGYADATRSIEYAALARFFSRGTDLAPELIEYFGSFQQVVSYLFDPDQIFADNLRRAGVRNLIAGSPKITGDEHAARQLARPLAQLALYLEDPAAHLSPPKNSARARPAIALHPGSGSESKNWPIERWVEVAEWLLAREPAQQLLLIGGEADAARVAQLQSVVPNDRMRQAQNLPLPELAGLLQDCTLFLGHDSGISHLAAALGVPALLLFGPTDPAIWAPANPSVRVLRAPNLTMAGTRVKEVLAALSTPVVAGWSRCRPTS